MVINMHVSVVVNIYNEEENIVDFLNSLYNQTFKHFQLIIVNDGSTDATMEIVNKYSDKFDIKLIETSHIGLRPARQIGVQHAKGDIIIIFDADEIIDSNCISELVKKFSNSSVGAVGGTIKSLGDTWVVRASGVLRQVFLNMRQKKDGSIDWIAGGCSAYMKDILNELGGLTAGEMGEDVDMSWKMEKHGYKVLCAKNAIVYHKDPDTLTQYMKREYKLGKLFFTTYTEHITHLLDWRPWSRYCTLVLILLFFVNWKYSVIGFFVAFLISQMIFLRVSGTFSDKINAWVLLSMMNLGWSIGSLVSIGKYITKKFRILHDYHQKQKV